MTISLIDRVIATAADVPEQASSSFTYSYFAFLRYFESIPNIEPDHVIIGAHFTYGWMPTMLTLKHAGFEHSAALLNQARRETPLSEAELGFLIGLINNSMVGVSKLLHFVAPERYAIWDSRVADYLYPNLSYSRMHYPATYHAYLQTCQELIAHPEFNAIHAAINQKMGAPVSALRAIEVVLYTGGRQAGRPANTRATQA